MDQQHRLLARRGILAGMAAAMAGVLTKVGERAAVAADGAPMLLGRDNTQTASCAVFSLGGVGTALKAGGDGTIFSFLHGGVAGTTDTTGSAGVYGSSQARGAYGVVGDCGGGTAAGVRGNGQSLVQPTAIGVLGVAGPSAGQVAAPSQPCGGVRACFSAARRRRALGEQPGGLGNLRYQHGGARHFDQQHRCFR